MKDVDQPSVLVAGMVQVRYPPRLCLIPLDGLARLIPLGRLSFQP